MNEPTLATVSPDPSKKRDKMQSAILVVVAVGVIAGLVFTIVTRDTPVSCPDELIGAWRTAARGYEDGMLMMKAT